MPWVLTASPPFAPPFGAIVDPEAWSLSSFQHPVIAVGILVFTLAVTPPLGVSHCGPRAHTPTLQSHCGPCTIFQRGIIFGVFTLPLTPLGPSSILVSVQFLTSSHPFGVVAVVAFSLP